MHYNRFIDLIPQIAIKILIIWLQEFCGESKGSQIVQFVYLKKASKQRKKEKLAEPLHSTVDDRKVENLLLTVTRHKLVINLTSLLRPARA